MLAVYDVGNLEEIKKYNSISIDGRRQDHVLRGKTEEPDQHAHRHRAVLLSARSTIPLIKQYIAEGNNPDQPGRLVQWLYPRMPVYTWRVPGLWFDIGSKETLEEANKIFAKF